MLKSPSDGTKPDIAKCFASSILAKGFARTTAVYSFFEAAEYADPLCDEGDVTGARNSPRLCSFAIRPHDGTGWSIEENIGHLLDFEWLVLARIDEILAGASVLTPADM